MKAVAYARFSSDNQREESITAQLRAIREYAQKHNIEIIKEYTDEARSATTDDRPGFLRMIADLKNGLKVDLVFVHKLDRFARNRYDAAVYRREIQRAGARLVAVDQPLDDSPESVLLESLLEGLAEYYSRNLAREVMKGMKENAYQGKFNGGWIPFGYRVENGRYIINETEAIAVRKIFEWVAEGKSYAYIQSKLNEMGYRTRQGKPFGRNSLHAILRNPKYAGIYVFNKVPRRINGKRNNRRKKPEEEIIIVTGAVPAIIDKELWDRVQKILDSRQHKVSPKDKGELYILTGKVVCGLCGSACTGSSKRRAKEGKIYRYYDCNAKKRLGTCNNRPWPKEELERYVLSQIEKRIFADISAVARKLKALVTERLGSFQKKQRYLQKELEELEGKINRILDLVEVGGIDVLSAKNRLVELESRKKAIAEELAISSPVPDLSKEEITAYLKHLQKDFVGQLDPLPAEENSRNLRKTS
ncbi:MAG: recombinase family protein [Thermoanaerobacteraceae bacterium]|nr:recombinase family protein [Thermoanaerobacteraceae bacterium]